jgi:hypothetical protein
MSGKTQKADIAFGEASEMTNLDVLQTFLDTTLERKGGYAVFDYENPSKTIFVELKTRRIRHDTYDTALIGFNKVAFCNTINDVDYWFAYCYTDGIFVIKFDKELFDTFEVRHDYRRGARDDCINREQSVVLIPTEHLKRVNPDEIMLKIQPKVMNVSRENSPSPKETKSD